MHSLMAEPAFFKQGGAEIAEFNARLAEIGRQLTAAYDRWESLEE